MIGVILVNFGGPRSGEEIRPFLEDIFRDVLPRPFKLLSPILAKWREPYAKKMYDAIGGASPVVGWTVKQAAELEKKLNYKVYAGMKYGHPSIEDAIADAKEDGCEKIIFLPLFPYQSKYTFTGSWHAHPLYISAMVNIIKAGLADWKAVPPTDINLIFGVHAIPASSARRDPYIRQIQESVSEIMRQFTGYNYHVAFQSQHGPIRWVGPSVKTTLKQIPDYALIIPLGFACENIETLYEIDQIYIPYAKQSLQLQNIARTPALNDNPQFIDLLANLVLEEQMQ